MKRKRRFTIASVYVAFGLAVGYILLAHAIPVIEQAAVGAVPVNGHASDILRLSHWVRRNQPAVFILCSVAAAGGLLLPLLFRPARYLVLIAALAIIAMNVAILAIAYGSLVSSAMHEASGMRRSSGPRI